MGSPHIHVTQADGVQRIVIDRPHKKNALTGEMYAALAEAFAMGEATKAVRVHFITGTQDCFTAGNDMASFLNPQAGMMEVLRVIEALRTLEKPLVVAVNGVAVGIGVTLLLHADLIYASDSATFKTPFVELGVVPEAGSSLLMPRFMGHAQAARMLLLGEVFTAQQALDSGLISAVIPHAQVADVALQKAQTLARRPPNALRQARMLMRRVSADALKAHIEVETQIFAQCLSSPELQEAVMAFLQKREPDFSAF